MSLNRESHSHIIQAASQASSKRRWLNFTNLIEHYVVMKTTICDKRTTICDEEVSQLNQPVAIKNPQLAKVAWFGYRHRSRSGSMQAARLDTGAISIQLYYQL